MPEPEMDGSSCDVIKKGTFLGSFWYNQSMDAFIRDGMKLPTVFTIQFVVEFVLDPGGTPLYQLYRYVPPQRLWFLSRFGVKTGIDCDHYGLKSGMVFKGTTRACKRICLF